MMNDRGRAGTEAPLVFNGWSIHAHPVFLDQLDRLIAQVEARKQHDRQAWQAKSRIRRPAAIVKLTTKAIPATPAFRQGDSLGDQRKNWFRARFFQRYRLFFRFDSPMKVIVLACMKDERTLRAYGSKTDADAVFKGMPEAGNPPDDLDMLARQAIAKAGRFNKGLRAASGD